MCHQGREYSTPDVRLKEEKKKSMAAPMCLKDLPEQCSLSLIQNQPGPLLVREFTEKKYTELLDNTGGRQTDISRLRVLNCGCHSNLGDTLFSLPCGFKACAAMGPCTL